MFSRVDSETSTHDHCCKNFVKKNGSELTENLSEFSDCEFNLRHELLTPSAWDLYHQVFHPTQDDEAIFASLADDIPDIYSDLKKGLAFLQAGMGHKPRRQSSHGVLFYSHWGSHHALRTMHFRLNAALPDTSIEGDTISPTEAQELAHTATSYGVRIDFCESNGNWAADKPGVLQIS